jgi:3-hydroxyisobutyrate dehydrogenase
MTTSTRVAVLGMGAMGSAVADRARQQGYDVVVWNRTPGRGGASPHAHSPVEAVTHADVVVVAVRDDAAVHQVCSEELLNGLGPSASLLILTTVTPATVRELEARRPGRVLDTPVMGSPQMVREGHVTFLVGGGEHADPAVFGLLDDLGAGHTRCGPAGGGTVMKIVSNLQLVLGVAALAEAVATAREQGVDDDVLRAVFGDSLVVSQGARMGLSAMLDPEHRGLLGPVSNAVNDVNLALSLAGDLDLVLSPTVVELLGRVADRQWPDFSAVVEGLTQ